jgi:r-opsin
MIFVLFVWIWATPFNLMPTMEIWNRYIPEGYLTTCSFDYLTPNHDTRLFVTCIFVYAYLIPVSLLVLFYSKILGQVRAHQKAMSEQVKQLLLKCSHK